MHYWDDGHAICYNVEETPNKNITSYTPKLEQDNVRPTCEAALSSELLNKV